MFVDVNEYAKKLSSSELVQLDENNGYRVVCRRLLPEHGLFRTADDAKWAQSRHNQDHVYRRDPTVYTTLKTLAEIAKRYLTENKTLPESDKYVSWEQAIAKGIYFRPEEKELDRGKQTMLEYFKQLAAIPSHQAFINGKPASELRKSNGGEDNILFRPMVQMALAEAIGKLVTRGVSLRNIVEELGRQEKRGQLRLTERTAPWFGVLCDSSGKMRRYKKSEKLCCRLFQYLLGGGIEDDFDREQLRVNFAAQRRSDPEDDMAIDLNGNRVEMDMVRLPNPWR